MQKTDTFSQIQQSVYKEKKGGIRGKLFEDYSEESPKITNKPRGSWMIETSSGDSSSQQSGNNGYKLVRKQERNCKVK